MFNMGGDDYTVPQRRKNKGDKRAKSRFMRYKRGGAQRVTNIEFSGDCDPSSGNDDSKNKKKR